MSKINIEIEKTMGLLNEIERISPDPMFYPDLLNKIKSFDEQKSNKKNIYSDYKNILFVLLILVNLFTVIYFYSIAKNTVKENKLKSTAKIYHIDQSNYNLLSLNE